MVLHSPTHAQARVISFISFLDASLYVAIKKLKEPCEEEPEG